MKGKKPITFTSSQISELMREINQMKNRIPKQKQIKECIIENKGERSRVPQLNKEITVSSQRSHISSNYEMPQYEENQNDVVYVKPKSLGNNAWSTEDTKKNPSTTFSTGKNPFKTTEQSKTQKQDKANSSRRMSLNNKEIGEPVLTETSESPNKNYSEYAAGVNKGRPYYDSTMPKQVLDVQTLEEIVNKSNMMSSKKINSIPNKLKYSTLLVKKDSLLYSIYFTYKHKLSDYLSKNRQGVKLFASSKYTNKSPDFYLQENAKKFEEFKNRSFNDNEAQQNSSKNINGTWVLFDDLTPLPAKSRKKMKNKTEKSEFYETERTAVAMRRLEYIRKFETRKRNNQEKKADQILTKIILIQRWWREMIIRLIQIRYIILIQSCFRGYLARVKMNEKIENQIIGEIFKNLNNFILLKQKEYALEKIKEYERESFFIDKSDLNKMFYIRKERISSDYLYEIILIQSVWRGFLMRRIIVMWLQKKPVIEEKPIKYPIIDNNNNYISKEIKLDYIEYILFIQEYYREYLLAKVEEYVKKDIIPSDNSFITKDRYDDNKRKIILIELKWKEYYNKKKRTDEVIFFIPLKDSKGSFSSKKRLSGYSVIKRETIDKSFIKKSIISDKLYDMQKVLLIQHLYLKNLHKEELSPILRIKSNKGIGYITKMVKSNKEDYIVYLQTEWRLRYKKIEKPTLIVSDKHNSSYISKEHIKKPFGGLEEGILLLNEIMIIKPEKRAFEKMKETKPIIFIEKEQLSKNSFFSKEYKEQLNEKSILIIQKIYRQHLFELEKPKPIQLNKTIDLWNYYLSKERKKVNSDIIINKKDIRPSVITKSIYCKKGEEEKPIVKRVLLKSAVVSKQDLESPSQAILKVKQIQRKFREYSREEDIIKLPIITEISSYVSKERHMDIPIFSISKDKTSSISNKDIIVNKNSQIEDIKLLQKEWLNHCKKIPQEHPLTKPKEDISHYMSKTIKMNQEDDVIYIQNEWRLRNKKDTVVHKDITILKDCYITKRRRVNQKVTTEEEAIGDLITFEEEPKKKVYKSARPKKAVQEKPISMIIQSEPCFISKEKYRDQTYFIQLIQALWKKRINRVHPIKKPLINNLFIIKKQLVDYNKNIRTIQRAWRFYNTREDIIQKERIEVNGALLTKKRLNDYTSKIKEIQMTYRLFIKNKKKEIIKKPIIQFEGSDYDKKRKELNTLVMKKVDVKPSIITKQVFRREYEESIPITKVITSSEIITKDIIENPYNSVSKVKTIQRGYRKSCKKIPKQEHLVRPIITEISSYVSKERHMDIPILSISKDKTSSISNKDIIVNKNSQIEDIKLLQKEWLNHCKKIPQEHPLTKPKEDISHYMSKTIKMNQEDDVIYIQNEWRLRNKKDTVVKSPTSKIDSCSITKEKKCPYENKVKTIQMNYRNNYYFKEQEPIHKPICETTYLTKTRNQYTPILTPPKQKLSSLYTKISLINKPQETNDVITIQNKWMKYKNKKNNNMKTIIMNKQTKPIIGNMITKVNKNNEEKEVYLIQNQWRIKNKTEEGATLKNKTSLCYVTKERKRKVNEIVQGINIIEGIINGKPKRRVIETLQSFEEPKQVNKEDLIMGSYISKNIKDNNKVQKIDYIQNKYRYHLKTSRKVNPTKRVLNGNNSCITKQSFDNKLKQIYFIQCFWKKIKNNKVTINPQLYHKPIVNKYNGYITKEHIENREKDVVYIQYYWKAKHNHETIITRSLASFENSMITKTILNDEILKVKIIQLYWREGKLRNNIHKDNEIIKKVTIPLNGSLISKERLALNDNAIKLIKIYYLNYLKNNKRNSQKKTLTEENGSYVSKTRKFDINNKIELIQMYYRIYYKRIISPLNVPKDSIGSYVTKITIEPIFSKKKVIQPSILTKVTINRKEEKQIEREEEPTKKVIVDSCILTKSIIGSSNESIRKIQLIQGRYRQYKTNPDIFNKPKQDRCYIVKTRNELTEPFNQSVLSLPCLTTKEIIRNKEKEITNTIQIQSQWLRYLRRNGNSILPIKINKGYLYENGAYLTKEHIINKEPILVIPLNSESSYITKKNLKDYMKEILFIQTIWRKYNIKPVQVNKAQWEHSQIDKMRIQVIQREPPQNERINEIDFSYLSTPDIEPSKPERVLKSRRKNPVKRKEPDNSKLKQMINDDIPKRVDNSLKETYHAMKVYDFLYLLQQRILKNSQEYAYKTVFDNKEEVPQSNSNSYRTPNTYDETYYISTIRRHANITGNKPGIDPQDEEKITSKVKNHLEENVPEYYQLKHNQRIIPYVKPKEREIMESTNLYDKDELDDLGKYINYCYHKEKNIRNCKTDLIQNRLKRAPQNNTSIFGITKFMDNLFQDVLKAKFCQKCYCTQEETCGNCYCHEKVEPEEKKSIEPHEKPEIYVFPSDEEEDSKSIDRKRRIIVNIKKITKNEESSDEEEIDVLNTVTFGKHVKDDDEISMTFKSVKASSPIKENRTVLTTVNNDEEITHSEIGYVNYRKTIANRLKQKPEVIQLRNTDEYSGPV